MKRIGSKSTSARDSNQHKSSGESGSVRLVRPGLAPASAVARRAPGIDQAVQIAGALLILVVFAATQFGHLDQRSRLYLVLNLVGSVILAILAGYEEQLGFLLLEGVWALVSIWSLMQVLVESEG